MNILQEIANDFMKRNSNFSVAVPPSIEAIKYAGLTLVASGAGLLGFGTLAERLGK